jgi:hypothetical protein
MQELVWNNGKVLRSLLAKDILTHNVHGV